MKRPVNLPLWFCIAFLILLAYDAFVVPYIGELNRQNAVTNIQNPSTQEHQSLAKFLVDNFHSLIQSGRQDRQTEHSMIMNETEIIKNDTQVIILMLKNGTY